MIYDGNSTEGESGLDTRRGVRPWHRRETDLDTEGSRAL